MWALFLLGALVLLFLIYPLGRFLCETVFYRRPLRTFAYKRHRLALGLGLCGGLFSAAIGVGLMGSAQEDIDTEMRRIEAIRARGEGEKSRWREAVPRELIERREKDRTAGLYVAISGVLAWFAAPVVFRNGPGAGVLLAGVSLLPALGTPGLVCCNVFVMIGAIVASLAPRPGPVP